MTLVYWDIVEEIQLLFLSEMNDSICARSTKH